MSAVLSEQPNVLSLALHLSEAYRSEKSKRLAVEVDNHIESPNYTEETLIIPAPLSLRQTLFSILFGSILFDQKLDTTNVPSVLVNEVELVSDLIESVYEKEQTEKVELALHPKVVENEDGSQKVFYDLYLGHKYFDVADPSVTFIAVKDQLEIHTSKAMFFKRLSGFEIERPVIKTVMARFDMKANNYKLRLAGKILEVQEVFDGWYIVVRK